MTSALPALQGDDLPRTKFRVARLVLFGKRRGAATDVTITLCGVLTLRLLSRWQSSPSTWRQARLLLNATMFWIFSAIISQSCGLGTRKRSARNERSKRSACKLKRAIEQHKTNLRRNQPANA
jgi:hypothetical protein